MKAPLRTSKIRLVHITPGLEMGGLEKLQVEFARHADRDRFELHFVSLSDRGSLAADIEAAGCRVTALNHPTGLSPRLLWNLTRCLRHLGAEVVHTHDDRALIYGTPAARRAGVRTVVHTRHGRSPGLSSRQKRLIRWASLAVTYFVCVSNEAAALSREHGIPSNKIHTIHNGIDLERFAYAGRNEKGPMVLVARMTPEKDVETLLRAFALVHQALPAARLEIAGDGICLADLKALATQLGLGSSVTFLGPVRDVASLLKRSALFVLPSLSEGISLTLLEAMASGLPVVATNVGGNPEVVAEGETGLLVPARSPARLAEAMTRLLRDPLLAKRMGDAGRRRVETDFDVRSMVASYESLYAPSGNAKSCRQASELEPVLSH